MFIWFWERETSWAEEEQREKEAENLKQAPPCQHQAVEGLEPKNCEIMTWAEIKSPMLNWLTHPGGFKWAFF